MRPIGLFSKNDMGAFNNRVKMRLCKLMDDRKHSQYTAIVRAKADANSTTVKNVYISRLGSSCSSDATLYIVSFVVVFKIGL